MEIIKEGNTKKIAKIIGYEIKCAKCGTIFRCKHSETREQGAGQGRVEWVINCPACNNLIHEEYHEGAEYYDILWTEGEPPRWWEVEYE